MLYVQRERLTSYSVAFSDLPVRIDRDVDRLISGGFWVHRPAVFFPSDGASSDKDRRRLALGQAQ